nr:membrane protein [Marseillevirus futianmevirus]
MATLFHIFGAFALVGAGVSFFGLLHGFRHGVWSACASLALGPEHLGVFSTSPTFVSALPAALGATTLAISPFSEYPLGTALYGVCYTVGSLVGSFALSSDLVVFSGVGFVLLRLLFN